MITVNEVAEKLNISSRMVRKLIMEGKLPALKFGNTYRIVPEDLEKFIQDSKVTPDK